jgi:hypothetical protein
MIMENSPMKPKDLMVRRPPHFPPHTHIHMCIRTYILLRTHCVWPPTHPPPPRPGGHGHRDGRERRRRAAACVVGPGGNAE